MTNPSEQTEREQVVRTAARNADWMQVVLNQGPPCFHFEPERGRFCLRAERWDGHGDKEFHNFVSLEMLLAAASRSGAEQMREVSGSALQRKTLEREVETLSLNRHGMPVYLEIHKGHRSGDLNFGVMTGLIQEFTLEEMQKFRQMLCVVIGIAENAFSDGADKRNPASQVAPRTTGGEPR